MMLYQIISSPRCSMGTACLPKVDLRKMGSKTATFMRKCRSMFSSHGAFESWSDCLGVG